MSRDKVLSRRCGLQAAPKRKKYWGRRRLACGQFGTNCLYKQCLSGVRRRPRPLKAIYKAYNNYNPYSIYKAYSNYINILTNQLKKQTL